MATPTDGDEMLVIGAGLMRTGTSSLKIALQKLLGRKCYHMNEVFSNPKHIQLWMNALDKKSHGEDVRRELKEILRGYAAAVDVPAAIFYQDLLREFPNAKVILTTRDPHKWYRSCIATVWSEDIHRFDSSIFSYFSPLRQHKKMRNQIWNIFPGAQYDIHNQEEIVRQFNKWNENVIQNIREGRLLVFDAEHGWEPLCNFLEVPIPDEPYPHSNKMDDFRKHASGRGKKSKMVTLAVLTAIAAGVGLIAFKYLRR